jgi:hypothetical protein
MGFRSLSADLDRLLDRFVAGEEPETTGDLAPLLHPAQVASVAFFRSLDPAVAEKHLAALRADRARNVMVLPPLRRPRLRLAVAGLIGAAFLVFGAGSAVAISSGAVPGDPLYGVKRAVERISLAMHRDPVGRAQLHVQFANNRLQEVAALTLAGRTPEELMDDLEIELDAAEHDALSAQVLGKDADAILAHVQQMIAKHVTVLTNVLAKVPEQARDSIRHAIDNAGKAQEKVQRGRTKDKTKNHGRPPATPPGKAKGAQGQL